LHAPDAAARARTRAPPQVRFDAPASALGKGFSSDEVMRVLAHRPGSHYAVESEVFTTAMYGDKFAVLTRATLAARGPRRCVLHVVYAVAFSPALTRMLRPIISKGVDGEAASDPSTRGSLDLVVAERGGGDQPWWF
jgi:hypothetical protein